MDKCLYSLCVCIVRLCSTIAQVGAALLLQSRFHRVKFIFFSDTWYTIFIVQTKTRFWNTSHFPRFISMKILWNSTDVSELSTRKHLIFHATEILVFPPRQSVQNKRRLLLIIRYELWEVSVLVNKENLYVRTGSSVRQAHSLFSFFLV